MDEVVERLRTLLGAQAESRNKEVLITQFLDEYPSLLAAFAKDCWKLVLSGQMSKEEADASIEAVAIPGTERLVKLMKL